MKTRLNQSFFVVLTGSVNSGKSFQMTSVLTARAHGEPIALPCAVILAEASGEGTMGEVLLDPGACVVWPCSNCEQATEAVRVLFPESGPLTLGAAKAATHKELVTRATAAKTTPPPPQPAHPNDCLPLRALAVDTASTLYAGSVNEAYRQLLAAAGGKAGVKPGGKGHEYNDPRELHKIAAKRCGDMLDRLNGVSMANRGLIVLVSCHTLPAMEARSAGEAVCVGEAPALGSAKMRDAGVDVPSYSRTWDALAAKANVVWHCFETVPDYRGKALADLSSLADAAEESGAAGRGVITKKGKYPGLGPVQWVKNQAGEGPLGIFGALPGYWHPAVAVSEDIAAVTRTPNLGKVLAYAIEMNDAPA